MTRAAVALCLVALTAAAAAVPRAPACGVAPRLGQRVSIAEETALIVWDPATKTEHFIRRGSFRTDASDFGFLVPTPAKPDLGEADPGVFGQLAAITAPKVEYKRVTRTRLRKMEVAGRVGAGAPMPKAGAVEVLGEAKVGGYDATIIAFRRGESETAAAGADILAKWLKDRGYAFGPALSEWLTWYVEHDWVITAFKVSGTAIAGQENPPVRMSFTTDRPFYPYREPADQRAHPPNVGPPAERLLRVFFVSPDGVAHGTLGKDGVWPASRVWADKVSADALTAAKLPAGPPAGELTLTEIEDRSSPRPGTDEVYFSKHHDQTPVHRPPVVYEIVDWVDPPAGPMPDLAGLPASVKVVGAAAGGAFAVFAVVYLVWVLRRP